MTPDKLVDWGISVTLCIIILSMTGIQDWTARLFGSRHTKKDLAEKIASLESRIQKLEKTDAT